MERETCARVSLHLLGYGQKKPAHFLFSFRMADQKRYNAHGFSALSGMLEHATVLQDGLGVAGSSGVEAKEPPSEVRALLTDIQTKLMRVMELLGGGHNMFGTHSQTPARQPVRFNARNSASLQMGEAIDGVYDGQGNMVSDDGTRYKVPPAYAAKLGLQEGDLLQVMNGPNGMRKFKRIWN